MGAITNLIIAIILIRIFAACFPYSHFLRIGGMSNSLVSVSVVGFSESILF